MAHKKDMFRPAGFYESNSEAMREWSLMRNYGLTLQDYNQMFEEQEGCCAICGGHQSAFRRSLCVDHDHATGKVRALLCDACNHMLGSARDLPKRLLDAAAYLRKHGRK